MQSFTIQPNKPIKSKGKPIKEIQKWKSFLQRERKWINNREENNKVGLEIKIHQPKI